MLNTNHRDTTLFCMSSCTKNQVCKAKSYSKLTSWLPAFIIAILPKCPFCIMAYSGAMSMCSGKMLFPNADTYSSYFILGLSLVVLLGVLLNQKGKTTWIAVGITSLGILLLFISQFYNISETLYYTAVGLLFFGIWFNGSFKYFYNKYFNSIRKSLGLILKTKL